MSSKTASTAEPVADQAYRAIFENAAIGIAFVTAEGYPLHINQALLDMLGYSRDELQRMAFEQFTHPDDIGADVSLYREMIAGKRDSYALDKRYIRRDGSVIWAHLTVAAERNEEGVLVHGVATVQDISDLRRSNEELERSNRDLEQFAYAASHDLQTPLRKVKSFSLLLQEEIAPLLEKAPPEQRERVEKYLSFVIEGSERSQELINGLLSFSRTGRRLERSRVSMDKCLDDALFILDEHLREKGVTVTRGELPHLAVDASLITRVFQNLVGNAIKFRHDGRSPKVEIRCEERESDWLFSVQDNGIGLDLRHQERVFVIFQRIGTRKAGTGLGLALCKKIIEGHGGSIWFDSQLGRGSTFLFTLPKESRRDAEPVDVSKTASRHPAGGGR